MGGWGDALVFLSDNALGALLGVAWCFIIPVYSGSSYSAYISAIIDDVLGSLALAAVTYLLVQRFGKSSAKVSAKKGRLARTLHTEIHVLIIKGFSLAMGSLHTAVAEDVWYAVSYAITDGESTDGSCEQKYQAWQVVGALGVAVAMCSVYGGTSFAAHEQKAKADTRAWEAVWDLVATSFSYAIGWSFFNALSMTIGCLPGNMYYYVDTQIIRAIPLCLISGWAHFYGLPRLAAWAPVKRTDVLMGLGHDAVYTVTTLSLFDIYYQPVSYFCSTTVANSILYTAAVLITAVAVTCVYLGWFDEADDEPPPDEPLGINRRRSIELAYNVAGWLVMFAWWHPLDTSLEDLYLGNGVLSYSNSPVATLFLTVFSAALATALVAAVITLLTIAGPDGEALLSTLPEWAQVEKPKASEQTPLLSPTTAEEGATGGTDD